MYVLNYYIEPQQPKASNPCHHWASQIEPGDGNGHNLCATIKMVIVVQKVKQTDIHISCCATNA